MSPTTTPRGEGHDARPRLAPRGPTKNGRASRTALLLLGGAIAPLLAPVPGLAQSAAVVNTVDTSVWSPPSPDPAGIVFVTHASRMIVSDSEVNEIPALFTGVNMFETALDGSVLDTFDSLDHTNEPTGLAYNPANGHLFIVTDNKSKRVFEIDRGADGAYGTGDDAVTSFSASAFGSNDAEGLTFNTSNGTLLVADGVNSEVYTVDPGFNGLFDGVPPAGDDVVSSFDTTSLGITDPEGIAYDSDFGHLYIVGKPSHRLVHATTSGTLLRTIDVSAAGGKKLAGLAYAPSSVDPSADFNLYVTDRRVDNNSDPDENDGRIYELSLPPFAGDSPPAVSITAPPSGASFVVGDSVTFTGSASDPEDGDLSASVQWSSNLDGALGQGQSVTTTSLSEGSHVVSASVTDSNGASAVGTIQVTLTLTPNAPPVASIDSPVSGSTYLASDAIVFSGTAVDDEDGDLGASLLWESDRDGELGTGSLLTTLSEGTHTVTASVTDGGGLSGEDSVNVTVDPPSGGHVTVDSQVASGFDDAEQRSSGNMSRNGTDLELVEDGADQQLVGLRFDNLFVPQGAGIVDARVQFQADETDSVVTDLRIRAEARDDAPPFGSSPHTLSNRPKGAASVAWSPPPWNSVGEAGAAQRTPNIALAVQEVVSRPGWSQGNSIAIFVSGSGERTAESYEGGPGAAPSLHLVYTTENAPPAVDAGSGPIQVTVSEAVALSGSVLDDGLPNPPVSVGVQWTKLDGPGTAAFSDPTSPTSTVSFSEVGDYRLGLIANDGELQGIDEVAVEVGASAGNTPPLVDAGADTTLSLGEIADLHGSVVDEGVPDPPGVDVAWQAISGPGQVQFGDPSATITTASFSAPGAYVLELSADDGELDGSDTLTATMFDASGTATLDVRVASGADDAEERASGGISLTSSDLELVFDSNVQTVGTRFTGLSIPPNATISDAYVQFQVDEPGGDFTELVIEGENADDAPAFVKANGNISSRPRTATRVVWQPAPWNAAGDSGPDQRTPQLAAIVQELVNRPGWTSGNAIVILFSGTGKRVAESFNGSTNAAALLHVEF